ncbi:ChaN family lipoprotein [Marivita sp. S2033]|uniref:ChaN family lipoprotein n=1 Tax=Marivita sp. S2033 TaxID=3373187 RepID=UPI0039826CDC
MNRLVVTICLAPAALAAGGIFDEADVVFLGELHDVPGHHLRQAEYTRELDPTALVFEMLTQAQADLVTPDLIADPDALEQVLNWSDSGWPDFAMYAPIFAAAPNAEFYGAAVPRDVARAAMQGEVAESFRGDAVAFGLSDPLPTDQQVERERLQMAAHCDALPAEMLPAMVDIQRLRDAELAYSARQAFQAHGSPVVVITGNGHARRDWGAPVYLERVAPELSIAALGQGEEGDGDPDGLFDLVEHSQPAIRDDPCDAFR